MARVMIVDDAAFMRMILREIVCEMGYRVVAEASGGKEAVRLYERIKPDLVIMDIIMPDIDGMSALRQILEQDPKANVIMCSVMSNQDSVVEAIAFGAKDFIAKPVQKDRVQNAIQRVLNPYELRTSKISADFGF